MKFDFRGKCTKLAIAPPRGARLESIRSIELTELSADPDAPVYGRATLRDVPGDVFDLVAQGVSVGRRYAITVQVDEIPDAQLRLGLEDGSAPAGKETHAPAETDTQITAGGKTVKTSPKRLHDVSKSFKAGRGKQPAEPGLH